MKAPSRRLLGIVAGMAAASVILVPSAAFAQGRGQGGPPPGRGETTPGNNLSVPAIFAGTAEQLTAMPALRVACGPDTTPQDPTGPQSNVFPGYWLQKTEATWSATCAEQSNVGGVTADWGANLTDAPNVATGKPIRVEVSLFDKAATGSGWQGYVITNLTPAEPDRTAVYGTDGTPFYSGENGGAFTRVWGPDTTLTIQPLDPSGSKTTVNMPAEINSTGAVVFGYNWGTKGKANTPAPGKYQLTFTIDSVVTITGVEAGTQVTPTYTEHTTSLDVTLTTTHGAGGGHGGGHGGHGGHGGGS